MGRILLVLARRINRDQTTFHLQRGGKYQGFGNTPIIQHKKNNQTQAGSTTLTLENFQKDPLGTFTKGWGLFSSAVSKSMEEVQETLIKPNVEQLSQKDLSKEALRAAKQFGQKFQESSSYGLQALNSFTKGLQQQLQDPQNGSESSQYSKLFDGVDTPSHASSEQLASEKKVTPAKKDTNDDEWDDF